jgi:predicted glycoside hydrolase/deacetylase ChbG (UPF0249 family)
VVENKMNPYLKQLGFEENDRVVVIHADDVGMCQATIPAFAELIEFGLLSSGAVMVPCPWFLEAADFCKQNPDADMGVHLTLTSEWKTYRWGPISTSDPSSGLIDEAGFFRHRAHQAQAYGDPVAVKVELKAQLERALSAGIDVTHIDTHMGTLAHPKFIPAYVQLGQQHKLPVMIPTRGENDLQELGLDSETAENAARFLREEVNMQDLVQIDRVVGLRLDQPQERLEQAKSAFNSLQPGLTHFVIHPAKDSPELRAATPTTWECRVKDYEAFRSEELRTHIKNLGIQIIGYKPFRELIQKQKI